MRRVSVLLTGLALVILSVAAPAEFERAMRLWDQGKTDDAISALRAAAEAGDPRAQDRLGVLHEEGHGLARDEVTAAYWYEKAAEQGYAPAQLNFARMYRNGKGVMQDETKAVHWFRQAAQGGLAIAQFFLGLMYDTGKGVPHDPVRSYMWFSLAAAQGDQDALFKRDRIAERLSEAQIAQAMQLGAPFGRMEPPTRPLAQSGHTRPLAATYEKPDGDPAAHPAPAPRAADRDLDREELRELQSRLATLGFEPGPADGRPGPRTRAAVEAFQRRRGLPVTGSLTLGVLEGVRAPPAAAEPDAVAAAQPMPVPPARIPAGGPALVREIQRQLAWLGYDPGPVDGMVGKRTLAAAADFQRARGQAPSRALTPGLLTSIIDVARERAQSAALAERTPVTTHDPGGDARAEAVAGRPLPLAPAVPTRPLASVPPPEAPVSRPDPFRLSGEPLVRELQRELTRLGYDVGGIDGVIGKRTVTAARDFQRRHGLAPTGTLTPGVLEQMQRADAPPAPAADPAPAPPSPSDAVADVAPAEPERPPRGGDALVWDIQRRLGRLGYDPGPADGLVGSRTVAAARQFQRDNGEPANGVLGPALLRQLDESLARGRPSRDVVKAIQVRLHRLGYSPGEADGLVGGRTTDAVRAFQRASGQSPDGRLSRELLERLEAASS